MIRSLFAFLLIGWAAPRPSHGQVKPMEPFPKEVADAWKKAGASIVWLGTDHHGFINPQREPSGRTAETPAFWGRDWKRGMLAGLPIPNRPFGLIPIGKEVDDDIVKELIGVKHLESLMVGNALTDVGAKELRRLPHLKTLAFAGYKVTDEGLKHLGDLTQLESLTLLATKVTDKGLKGVAGLKQLRHLNLSETKVTEKGLTELYGLKELRTLQLFWIKVSPAAMAELKRELPKLNVYR